MSLCDSDRNILADLGHEQCEWHCAECRCCSHQLVGPFMWTPVEHVIDETDDEIYCLECSPDYVQPAQASNVYTVVSGDMVRRPHWDETSALMVLEAGDTWFRAMHYRCRPGTNDFVPVHASRKVWPQDAGWVAL